MKQSEEVRAFKNELTNYFFYQHRIKKLNELIEYCYHMLGGIKGVDTTKEPSQSHVHNLDVEYKIRDEIELHESKIKRTRERLKELDEQLLKIEKTSSTDVKNMVFEMYAKKVTSAELGERYGYSPSNIQYIVNKAIKKALND